MDRFHGASIIACNGSAVHCRCLRSVLHDRQGAGREASSAISLHVVWPKGLGLGLKVPPQLLGRPLGFWGKRKLGWSLLYKARQGEAKQWSPAFIISFISTVPHHPTYLEHESYNQIFAHCHAHAHAEHNERKKKRNGKERK